MPPMRITKLLFHLQRYEFSSEFSKFMLNGQTKARPVGRASQKGPDGYFFSGLAIDSRIVVSAMMFFIL